MHNVEIGPGPHGYQYVEKVRYQFEGINVDGDALPMCVVQNVQNKSVTLQDSSNKRISPFWGYVGNDSVREVGGGQVITYLSDDKKSVVADGVASYRTDAFVPIDYSVRFSLTLKSENNILSAVFSNIEQAQLSTGVVANDGYNKLGAWPGMAPELAISEMKKLADKIVNCLRDQ